MKIIFLARRFYPLIGGVETHVIEISKELIRKGHKVIVVTEARNEATINKDKFENQKYFEGIEIVRIKVGSDDWFKKFRIWREIWKFKSEFKNADVIHCHDVFFWYLPFRFIYPFKKVYTTFHGYETKFPPDRKAIVVRKISEKLSKGNICVGNYIKKWYGTTPSYVIYGGVESRFFGNMENEKHQSQLDIIFIGRMQEDLGIKTYLDSLKLLNRKNINYKFQAYGDGKLKNEIENFGRVHGSIKNLEIVIKNADVVFCSSYLTMLQALAAKKIVIAVYENELKENYLKDSPFAKYIYICSKGNEIVDILCATINEPWKSSSMIENGYKWANQQTWERVVKTYLELWNI